jgi:hypothetical protein
MDDDNLLQYEIVKRLDIIIKLLLEARSESPKEKPDRPQIDILWKLGLSPSEIGRIMGLPTTRIGAHIAQIKQRNARRKK